MFLQTSHSCEVSCLMFSNRVFPWLLNKGREVKSWESPSLQLFNGHVLGGFSQKLETSPSYLKSRLEEKCEKKGSSRCPSVEVQISRTVCKYNTSGQRFPNSRPVKHLHPNHLKCVLKYRFSDTTPEARNPTCRTTAHSP